MVQPGSDSATAALTIFGNYTQSPLGVLSIDLGGTTPGTGYDQLIVNGAANLDGTLNLDFINGYVPDAGDEFDIMHAWSEDGLFSAIYCSDSSLSLDVNYGANEVQIYVESQFGGHIVNGGHVHGSSVPEPGPVAVLAAALIGGLLQRRRRARQQRAA